MSDILTYAEAVAECERIAPASKWGYFEVPDVWLRHLVSFAHAVNASGLAITMTTCKEKFGGLDIYYETRPMGGRHPRIDALVDAAQDACGATCSECGARGYLVSVRRWLSVLCAPCRGRREAASVAAALARPDTTGSGAA